MRILLDDEGFSWDEAWDITTRVMSYTNHTILAEALEKWPVEMIKKLLPRIYMIIEEMLIIYKVNITMTGVKSII